MYQDILDFLCDPALRAIGTVVVPQLEGGGAASCRGALLSRPPSYPAQERARGRLL